MSLLGLKLRSLEGGMVMFFCPGCKTAHSVRVSSPAPLSNWGYNGNPDAPSFTPSILVRGSQRATKEEYRRIMAGEEVKLPPMVCHSFVTNGRIQFLGDCTHALASQTVDLPDWEQFE